MKIAPSILSADFGRLNEDIKSVEPYSDILHVDVMDGHFVDNITIGPAVLKDIRTKLPVDVHLMIKEPLKYAPEFAKYCQMISFHAELFKSEAELRDAIRKVKALGVQAGLALNPDKDISMIEPVLEITDYVLIMSVYAGFAGQKFMPEVLHKIIRLRQLNYTKDIEIDGGINIETISMARDAGASIIVAGSSIFSQKDRQRAIEELRGAR
jgi:ribulose-phosphate 3-epimerase